MKRFLIPGVAAISLLFPSCSNDESIDVPALRNAIEFSPFVNYATRSYDGGDLTTANFDAFKVWSIAKGPEDGSAIIYPFNAASVSKSGTVWSYATPVYWQNGYNYSFVAVAPAERINEGMSSNNPITVTRPTELTGSCATIKLVNIGNETTTRDGYTDLVVAVNRTYAETAVVADGSACPGPVNMQFEHALCRVNFLFENAMEDLSTLQFTDVTITNAYKEGTLTLNSSTAQPTTPVFDWTGVGNQPLKFGNVGYRGSSGTTVTQITSKCATPGSTAGVTERIAGTYGGTSSRFMIPIDKVDVDGTMTGVTYAVTFTINRTIPNDGGTVTYTKTAMVPYPADGWKPGYSYTFSASINSENITPGGLCPISFTADVTEWQNAESPVDETEINPQTISD